MKKKHLAFTMAVLMMLPSLPVSASGDEMEDVNTNVYQVDLPMNTDGIFDFILDPQGLINKTDAAAYNGKKFEKDSTVFFKRTDGKAKEDYSSASDHVTIVNKSSMPVNVSLNIKVSEDFTDRITLAGKKKSKKDTKASLYLALKDKDREIPIGRDGLSLDVTVDAAPDGAYEYSYDKKSEKNIYKLKEDISDIRFGEYSFQLTGATNGKDGWTKLGDIVPKIKVDWKVSPKEGTEKRKDAMLEGELEPAKDAETGEIGDKTENDTVQDVLDKAENKEEKAVEKEEEQKEEESKAPSIAKNEYTVSAGNPVSVEVDLGSSDMVAAKVVSVKRKGTDEELLDVSDEVTYKDRKIVFGKEWVDKSLEDKESMPASLIVTFDDVNTTKVEIVLKK